MGGMLNETLTASAALVGRLLLASLFVLEGWSKPPLSVMAEAKNAVSDHAIPS